MVEHAPTRAPRAARADRIGLVVLGWHGLLVAGYLVLLRLLPERGDPPCAGYLGQCLGPRAGASLLGAVVGAPALLVSLGLAAALAWRISRRPGRSAARVGSLAAGAALGVTAGAGLLLGLVAGVLTAS